MKVDRDFPDFFIGGVTKSGTTSLYSWLDQHPDIYMCRPHKEPIFFEAEFEKGTDFYWDKYFSSWDGQRLIGEANVRNFFVPFVTERIHSVAPDARFIIIMRNPIDRALAHWWHLYYRKGANRDCETIGFEDAIRDNAERLNKGFYMNSAEEIKLYQDKIVRGSFGLYRTYLDAGYYAEHIERYFKFFPKEQFKFILFEELVKDSLKVVKESLTFLGLEASVADGFDFSAKKQVRRLKLNRLPCHISNNMSLDFLKSILKNGLGSIRKRPKIKAEMREWLVEHYRPHNKRLEDLLGIKLDHWR